MHVKTRQHRLRVRYQETDQMGVVYHANYLNWMEIGRTEWIRAEGLPYRRLEERGLLLPVVDLQVSYRHPARYDDIVEVHTRVTGYSRVKLEFEYEIWRVDGAEESGEERSVLLLTGLTRHIWMNASWKPCRIDKEAPELYAILVESGGRDI
ncbi:acyl-CoA thioesterase [Paenibacillus thermoaerophilus]|uniref:Acyl-CoA thioesterase n=1 Tax=Paenibacillus thermoaerophilus TaxID=1215385 RepID=A0ABW2UZ03_9BACL|nr:thioesterase family protein [Paenibacillus thermoaerophilus]TMV16010.1 acyl-CoA thioesterase [Paenibacillus thermoaerophilus]